MLSQVKLIAEPWDLGEGGYQVGNFPVVPTENLIRGDTQRRACSRLTCAPQKHFAPDLKPG